MIFVCRIINSIRYSMLWKILRFGPIDDAAKIRFESILRSTGTGTESVPVLPILIFTRTRTHTRTGFSAKFLPVPVTVLLKRKVTRTRYFFRTHFLGKHPYPFLTRTWNVIFFPYPYPYSFPYFSFTCSVLFDRKKHLTSPTKDSASCVASIS